MTPISAISPPPRAMMAPLPNCFSMAAMAVDTAFSLSLMVDMEFSSLVGSNCFSGRWFEGRSSAGVGCGCVPSILARPPACVAPRARARARSGDRSVEHAILQRLGEVGRTDAVAPRQISDGACHPPDAGDGAGREREPFDGPFEQTVSRVVEPGVPLHLPGVEARVGRPSAAD